MIYDALLRNICLKITYKPLENEQLNNVIISPLGLVMRHNVGYLVGTMLDNFEIKQFALHRFQQVKVHERQAQIPKNFSLESYISDGGFDYPVRNAEAEIHLMLIVKDYMKLILIETPLSENQVITDYKDNFYLLRATVKNTRQLRWWIHSFATGIVVLEPVELRQELMSELNELKEMYEQTENFV